MGERIISHSHSSFIHSYVHDLSQICPPLQWRLEVNLEYLLRALSTSNPFQALPMPKRMLSSLPTFAGNTLQSGKIALEPLPLVECPTQMTLVALDKKTHLLPIPFSKLVKYEKRKSVKGKYCPILACRPSPLQLH